MSTVTRCLIASLILLAAACAGSDGDDVPPTIDAPVTSIDAPISTIDAPTTNIDAPPATPGVGTACTGTMQGTCPTGFECLNLQGGTGSWCSKRCTGVNDQSCAVGYSGPGFPSCLLAVTPAGGGTPQNYCAVVCFDAPGAPTICPGGDPQCNNTCTTPLQCAGNLTDMNNMVVGRVCQ